MTTVQNRSLRIFLTAIALVVASMASAQQSEAITPIAPGTCPYTVEQWAERTSLPIASIRIGDADVSVEDVQAFLRQGQPDGREDLSPTVRFVQEWLAYELNMALGFTPTVETELVGADAASLIASLFGGLPSPDQLDVSEDRERIAYLDRVLADYNNCLGLLF